MHIIGITGGVGSGKSSVLEMIGQLVSCRIIRSDELAKSLEEPGQVCFDKIVDLLGSEILNEDGFIDNKKMAAAIFEDKKEDKLSAVNGIIHPEVKKRILSYIDEEKNRGTVDFFFIEAALLIEDHYDLICDELWYIYCDEATRRNRLKQTRGYSDEKIDSIFSSQLDDATFRKYCKVVIDNSLDAAETEIQIKTELEKARN